MDQKPAELRVVGARTDKKMSILYLENGEELIIKQGDHRLGDLMDVIIPITTRGEVAVVNLTDFSIYAAFEHKTQGMTKFFRMAKNKVKGFFGGQTDTHETHIPEDGKQAILRTVARESMTEDEVLEHGETVAATDEINEKEEVVVAVVTTPATATEPEKKTVIPGVNKIKPLIDHAVKTGSPEAVQNFLNHCTKFIDKRGHTVDDLIRFLEKGDLPLSDDGCIIAYKRLKSVHGEEGVFVDCHTGRIRQRVGSYVCVNEDLVDLNRRNECSNGLHIGRRAYMGSFTGDVWVLCKIDPEDVMVVPHNDPNKVRVKGYHILDRLGPEAISALQNNKPMTGDEGALAMVYRAIKGQHIDRIERVQVNGQGGTNVVTTSLRHDKSKGKAYDHTSDDLKRAAALDDETNIVGAIDPREINKKVNEEIAKVQEEKQTGTPEASQIIGNNPEKVIVDEVVEKPKTTSALDDLLLDYKTAPEGAQKNSAAQAIMAFKKSKKKGWDKLGIDDNLATQIIRDAAATAPEPAKAEKPKAGTKEKKTKVEVIDNPPSEKGLKTIEKALKQAPKKKVKPVKNVGLPKEEIIPSTGSLTLVDRAREMFNRGLYKDAKNLSKTKKKSLKALGFSAAEIEKIEANL